MSSHIPSLATLECNDDGRLAAELRLVGLRSQAAVVRALADQVERLSREAEASGEPRQLAEEMARLGARLLDAAAALEERLACRGQRGLRDEPSALAAVTLAMPTAQ